MAETTVARHTPGPWISHDQGRTVVQERANAYLVIANLPQPDHGSREANARLIALAPEMAILLRRVVEAFDHGEESPDFIEDIARIVDDARAPLARLEAQ